MNYYKIYSELHCEDVYFYYENYRICYKEYVDNYKIIEGIVRDEHCNIVSNCIVVVYKGCFCGIHNMRIFKFLEYAKTDSFGYFKLIVGDINCKHGKTSYFIEVLNIKNVKYSK